MFLSIKIISQFFVFYEIFFLFFLFFQMLLLNNMLSSSRDFFYFSLPSLMLKWENKINTQQQLSPQPKNDFKPCFKEFLQSTNQKRTGKMYECE